MRFDKLSASIWSWVTKSIAIFKPLLQKLHADAHLFAQFGVEVAEGLVQEQHTRLGDQRARESDALLLAAAEQRPGPIFESGQADEIERAQDAVLDFVLGKPARFERKGDVFRHGHVRPNRIGLKHHADVALIGRQQPSAVTDHDRLIAEKDIAGVGCLQTGDHAQGGGLTAAARAEQSENLAVIHLRRKDL